MTEMHFSISHTSLFSSLRDPAENHQFQIAESVGLPMCQALLEYDQGNYNQAVELLKPIRNRFVEIGGSDAQVFHRFTAVCIR